MFETPNGFSGPRTPLVRIIRIICVCLLFTGCDPQSCTWWPSGGKAGPGTPGFLDSSDFDGSFDEGDGVVNFGGRSLFSGRVVFANLPRAYVQQVLPIDLQLADNNSTTNGDEHPVLLIYGVHADPEWVFPWGSFDVGDGYRELILMIPFVQREGGELWHNYMTRIYLDNKLAEILGNQQYGYFKQVATLTESDFGSGTSLAINRNGINMFEWFSMTVSAYQSNSSALADLDNYADAMEVLSMPILGTFVNLGGLYVCSYWYWDLSGAEVRPIDVSMEFHEEFRDGMEDWVDQGVISSVMDGAFQIRDIEWRMAYPAQKCSF